MPIPKLNEYLQPIDSPIATRPSTFYIDQLTELDTRYIKPTQVNITKFARNSTAASGVTTTMVQQNESVTFTMTLAPKYNPSLPQGYANLAVPFVSAYEGTAAVGTLKIWPNPGDSSLLTDYHFYGGCDYATTNGTNSVFKLTVERMAAGSAHVYFVGNWRLFETSTSQST